MVDTGGRAETSTDDEVIPPEILYDSILGEADSDHPLSVLGKEQRKMCGDTQEAFELLGFDTVVASKEFFVGGKDSLLLAKTEWLSPGTSISFEPVLHDKRVTWILINNGVNSFYRKSDGFNIRPTNEIEVTGEEEFYIQDPSGGKPLEIKTSVIGKYMVCGVKEN